MKADKLTPGNWCFALVKPRTTNSVAEISTYFEKAGLTVLRFKKSAVQLTGDQIDGLIGHLKTRNPDAYRRNFAYYRSGPIIPLILIGPNAVKLARATAGATNPPEASPGTIRRDLSTDSIERCTAEGRGLENVIHVSDTDDAAQREAALVTLWNQERAIFAFQTKQKSTKQVLLNTGHIILCSETRFWLPERHLATQGPGATGTDVLIGIGTDLGDQIQNPTEVIAANFD